MGRILRAQLLTYPLPLNRQRRRESSLEWGTLLLSWRGWLQEFGMGVGQEITVGNYEDRAVEPTEVSQPPLLNWRQSLVQRPL